VKHPSKLWKWCHGIYKKALRDGILVKGPCAVCHTTQDIEGHHKDHTKPLEVEWLCASHHAQIQGIINRENGHIFTISTSETCAKAGKISGRRNVESGHIARLANLNRGKKRVFSDEWLTNLRAAQQRRRSREKEKCG
jgi:hypothetical protein